ncbi:MAG: sulfatase [Planctomycetes bacterium]|nr:sulfatase [Planctomycetota bacterium]
MLNDIESVIFRTGHPPIGRLVMLALILATVGACRRPSEPTVELPNIVLITIDTLRADHLGCYGYFRDTSPTIDALAAESVFFERCIVPMATTLPTHASIFTGTYPLEHGILANYKHGGFQFVPSPKLASLAQFASRAGYQTAAFVSATPVKRGTGMEAGFDTFDEPSHAQRKAGKTTEAVLAWLKEREQKPFLLWVHYFDPHGPYAPPPPYDTRYSTDEQLESYLARARFADRSRRPGGKNVVTRPAINGYDGEIRYTDDQLAKLFGALKGQGLWDDSIVVLIGDHGEGLGQHNVPGHALLWDEQLHVPLMIRVPGAARRRVARPMSAVDVLPTLLGLIDLPNSESFLEQMSGVDALAGDDNPRYILSRLSDRQLRFDVATTYSITGGGWKYVHAIGGEELLFDLGADPHELRDVAADHPEVVRDLCARLEDQVTRQLARGADLGSGGLTPLSEKRRRELENLGYAGVAPDESAEPLQEVIECSSEPARP